MSPAIAWPEEHSVGRRASDLLHCDRIAMALIKGIDTPGLNVNPILPDKYYLEARISSDDRIVFRMERGAIFFLDVIKHDDIERYGRRPRQVLRKPR